MDRAPSGSIPARRRRTSYSTRLGYDELTVGELVQAIENDDDWAWQALVDRLSRNVWGALSVFNVDNDLRQDAAAETWKTLLEHLDRIRDTERLAGWIAIVAANNMRKILARRKRSLPISDVEMLNGVVGVDDPDPVVDGEIREALTRAVDRLSPREQAVVLGRAFTDEPEPLAVMEQRLGIPRGSIGPTLGRCVRKLRSDPELLAFFPGVGPIEDLDPGKADVT